MQSYGKIADTFNFGIFFTIVAKHYRHQDTKAQKGLLTNGVSSWLCAFVATFPACPG
jgi:hypothetical protein